MEVMTAQEVAENHTPVFGRAALSPAANIGAVSIEQERAIAEVQGQIIIAQRFKRDLNAAFAELMEACKLPAFAEVAFYNVPQGGSKVSDLSIRAAEEIARVYGNFEYGHRELSRSDSKSEIEVFAWDKEKNNRSLRQITVMHTIDTRQGPRALRDQKEIDNKIANVASKQVRGRILALMPKWMTEAVRQECRKTLAGDNSIPLSERIRKMTQAFSPFGVSVEMLEAYLGHKLDRTTSDEFVDITGVFNAIRDGVKPSEFFGGAEEEQSDTAAAITDANAAGKEAKKTAPKAEAKKADAPKAEAKTDEPKADAPKREEHPKTAEQAQEQAPAQAEPAQAETASEPAQEPQQAAQETASDQAPTTTAEAPAAATGESLF